MCATLWCGSRPYRSDATASCGSGGRIRTTDLRVMSPTSCHCSTPRRTNGGARTLSPSGLPLVPAVLACFTTWFGMGQGGTTPLHARHWCRGVQIRCTDSQRPGRRNGRVREALGHAPQSPVPVTRPAVLVASPVVSGGPYLSSHSEGAHLEAHFPLRCFQRFLLPTIATEPAGRPTTPPPAGRPRRSSRTERSSSQPPKRSARIETELSHDVLNPARVPL